MAQVTQVPTVKKIKYFKDFYALGFDQEKVEEGVEDLTELRDIDSSKDWNPGLVACRVKYYSDLNTGEGKIREINEELEFAHELN
jgi:hypothetical protein